MKYSNTKIFKTGLIPIRFVLTYGTKAYARYVKEELGEEDVLNSAGCTSSFIDHETGIQTIIIAVVKRRRFVSEKHFKSIVIHEMSHATTYAMQRMNMVDDEFRSYTMQWLYKKVMPYLNKKTKGENNE